jgi:hypothetical protein
LLYARNTPGNCCADTNVLIMRAPPGASFVIAECRLLLKTVCASVRKTAALRF